MFMIQALGKREAASGVNFLQQFSTPIVSSANGQRSNGLFKSRRY